MKSPQDKPIPVEDLSEALLRKWPVWEFCNDDSSGETLVRPVRAMPATASDNRLFGSELRFADGTPAFGMLGNLSLTDPVQNTHFLTLTLFFGGVRYDLARYHDFDVDERGPQSLAKKVRKDLAAVFPIAYDVSASAQGAVDCVQGMIPAEPKQKLSREEIIALAIHG